MRGQRMPDRTSQLGIAANSESLTRYAAAVFENEQAALDWLQGPVVALGQQRPCDLWLTPEGRAQIAQVLRKIEHGEFT